MLNRFDFLEHLSGRGAVEVMKLPERFRDGVLLDSCAEWVEYASPSLINPSKPEGQREGPMFQPRHRRNFKSMVETVAELQANGSGYLLVRLSTAGIQALAKAKSDRLEAPVTQGFVSPSSGNVIETSMPEAVAPAVAECFVDTPVTQGLYGDDGQGILPPKPKPRKPRSDRGTKRGPRKEKQG
jgi:hypothetical protein